MELFDGFMCLFKKWVKEKNDKYLSEHLKKGRSDFQNLTTNDIDSVLSVLLDDKTGLLHLLADASEKKEMKLSISEGFRFLKFIIEKLSSSLDQYLITINKVCQSAITTKCLQNVKTAAADCFDSLIQICSSHDLELDEIVQNFINELESSTSQPRVKNHNNRAKFFQVLGSIEKYHSNVIALTNFNTIFDKLINEFDGIRSRCKSNLQSKELKKYLTVTDDLLTNFKFRYSQEESENRSEYYKKLYQCIKELCSIDETQKFTFVSRAAIVLFGNRMYLFESYIYADALDDPLFWHNTLLKWTNTADIDNTKSAINALRVYYQTIATILITEAQDERSKNIFEKLKQCFADNLTNNKVTLITLQLSICGFGHMAALCKNYESENDVLKMFSLIALRATIIDKKNDNEMKDSLENIACCQKTLSQILLELTDLSMDQLDQISTLSLILIRRFPELPVTSHSIIVSSLIETIYNIRQAYSRRWYEEFIRKLVYEGIKWSCSYASHERHELPKDYLPLWKLMIDPIEKIFKVGSSVISVRIFENIIETCTKLIKKLNLRTRTDIETFDIPVAVNDTDFRVFIDLVDIFVNILQDLKPEFIESKINWFLCEMVKESIKNSSISGFYKLLRSVLYVYNINQSSSSQTELELHNETVKILSYYLLDTIDNSFSFSGELQASCLTMIFEMPVSIGENMLENLISTFKTAFSLGQSNPNLAQSALNALEKWTKNKNDNRTKKFLIDVVPSLEPYLQSDETTVELQLPKERKVIKNIILTDHQKTPIEFQRRILLFFGSLNSEITSNFPTPQYYCSEILSDDHDLLDYTLSYEDISPKIYLDTSILSRTIELALASPDRRTRVIACEVLHSIVTVMLAKKVQLPSMNLLPLFKKICPVLLRLGSDADQVIQQLFYPLMIQLTHSSAKMFEPSETDCLIEILFDSLTHGSNMALSDFSGVCLAEFLKWSVQESVDPNLTYKRHVETIMSKIINFALHPSVSKRIGAAIAFNYLYSMLRENETIIDIYWLELLFCFIKSLHECNNNSQILKSLKNVQMVIGDKFDLLNQQSKRRLKPTEFEGTLLKDAADWLLVQCGSLDKNCRSKSMEVLKEISNHVTGFQSVQEIFADYVNTNRSFLTTLFSKIKTLSIETMKPLLRTLDYYIWILDEDIMSLDSLFPDTDDDKNMIFEYINDFISLLDLNGESSIENSEFTKQYEEFSTSKYEIISKIFTFIKILLKKMEILIENNAFSFVPTFFWNDKLYSLISTCIFNPEVFGFCLQNLEIMESLPSKSLQLLNPMIKTLDSNQFSSLSNTIAEDVESKWLEFSDLDTIFVDDINIELKSYLKGLIILEKFDQFEKLYAKPANDYDSANKLLQIFNSLKVVEDGKVFSRKLESSKSEYLENLLELFCLKFEENVIRTLVLIVDSKTELSQNDSTIMHGEYFMNFFRTPILQSLLKHIKKSIDILLSISLNDKFDIVFIILEDLLIYVNDNKESCEEFLSELEAEFVEGFSTIKNRLNHHVDNKKDKLINLYSLLVQVSKNPTEIVCKSDELYSWIMNEIADSSDLEYKTRIMNKFLPCIISDGTRFKNCLDKLKADYYSINMNNLVKGSLIHLNIMASFQTLLNHLPTLKSVTLFDCLIHLTIENIRYFWDKSSTKYLTAYFNEISNNESQKSLRILYDYFMSEKNSEARLTILNKLLLKCIHFCKAEEIGSFFQPTMKFIYDIILQDFDNVVSDHLENLVVSKIGCYKLLEIMFARVSLENINKVDHRIVKDFVESVRTGKELFQALNVPGVEKLEAQISEAKKLIRLLHCAAFNYSIAITSLRFDGYDFYEFPFAEKSQLIWKNIIDIDKEYEFKQDFVEIPKEYKKQINIRKQTNPNEIHDSFDNSVGSTFNRNLYSFDSNESDNVESPSEMSINEELMCLVFEIDDLNKHECMGSICGIITHMISNNIFILPNDGELDLSMPKWMENFLSSFEDSTFYNVKLFLIKVILNVQEAFKPYAKKCLTPILKFLNSHSAEHQYMNYVIKDILIMLIDWHDIAVPSEDNDKQLAQELLEMIIRNADSDQRYIYKDNVEVISNLIKEWKSCLKVPEEILKVTENSSPKFRVRMILLFLRDYKLESLALSDDIFEYLNEKINNSDEEIVSYVYNAFGLILNILETNNMNEKEERILDSIKTSVESNKNCTKYIKCIYEVNKFHPNIINHYFEEVKSKFSNVGGDDRSKCLELFLSALENETEAKEKEISEVIKEIKFQDVLMNKTCRIVALKMMKKLLNILKPSDYLQLAQLVVKHSKDAPVAERELITDIFVAVHRKYSDNMEEEIAVSKLKDLSRHVLLSGLLDADESLQKKILQFWTKEGNMTDKSIERMLQIFELYDPDLESIYLPIVPLMMLHLLNKNKDFTEKMFPDSADGREFEDYQIEIRCQSQNVGSSPLFTSSSVEQIREYYSKSIAKLNKSLFSRASQLEQSEQTSIMRNKTIPQPSENRKSTRLLNNTKILRFNIIHEQIDINTKRDEILKTKPDLQRNSIKIYRKYRIGCFPDTEISHASLIEPLQELVKNDQVIARDLTVAIFRSIVEKLSSEQRSDFFRKLSTSLKLILDKTQGSKAFIATVMEIILNSNEIYVDSNLIANVSKSNGLLSLGTLLLEEKMISGYTTENIEPSPKKFKFQKNEEGNDWLQLANIYKSMNEFDIVQIIFGSEKFGNELQEASVAQAASSWRTAISAYEEAYGTIENRKEYCQESMFVCLAHLSDWNKINTRIKTELNGDLNSVWEKPMNENWMTSWVLQAQIHRLIKNDDDDGFRNALNEWIDDKDKLTQLKTFHGEEMAIFYIDKSPEFSQNCLTSGLEKIIQEWKHLNPFHYEQKTNKYLKLRGLSDIKTYSNGIRDKDKLIPNVKSMINFWDNSVPANQDNLLLWDKDITYRLYFFELLKKKFTGEASNETNNYILDDINSAVIKQCLNITHIAYEQSNPDFMDKYLDYSKSYLTNADSGTNNEWHLAFAKYKYLRHLDSKTEDEKYETFIDSWEVSHNLLINDYYESKVQMDIRQHIGSLVIELQKLASKSDPISKTLHKSQSISKYLAVRNVQESIVKQLSDYCLTRLKECYESVNCGNRAECYLKVSMYCHSMNNDSESGLDISKEYIHSTLSAMSYGSLEATQYFPCLLHLNYSKNEELGKIFKSESEKVETWMFLKWQAQLLSQMGIPIKCEIISPILINLAKSYPNSFAYSFRLTKEMNQSLSDNKTFCKLTEILAENKDLELFLEAMNHVVQPKQYFLYYMKELLANTPMGIKARNILSSIRNQNVLVHGSAYNSVKDKIKEVLCNIYGEPLDLDQVQPRIISLLNNLRDQTIVRRGCYETQLKEFSPWLHKFSGGNIEVPGQYAGDKRPMPSYHVRIVKLNPIVMILPSIRKPIRITMLGNDGRNYNFLVKFGEDLRTDERIEQLFVLMNRILQGDAVCRQPQLSIETYLVIPLSSSLGLIQWVDNTKPFREIIISAITDSTKKLKDIQYSYLDWIDNPQSNDSWGTIYKKALFKFDRQKVTEKFENSFKKSLDWDVLRKAFNQLSLSPESFFTVRQDLVRSYATMCIAQWILGIGDRHLGNTLISCTSGKAVGIDFGYSFDTALDLLAVPEFVPFRLTPQILGLLQPFDEHGLLKVTMINVLRALKRGKEPLLACMKIFIQEPLLDWLAKQKTDVKWNPQKKINIVVDKLNGAKPSKILSQQFKDRYNKSYDVAYLYKYTDIINGYDNGFEKITARSRFADKDLSVEEQVECLLDQATDPNILGRMWYGWEPWI